MPASHRMLVCAYPPTFLRTKFNVDICRLLMLKGRSVPERNPAASRLDFEKERNEGDVVLSPEKPNRLLVVAPPWLQPIILVAYDSGMYRVETRST